ncbi:hypothetical protein ACFE04_024153 [Oxalis oulophora]
MASLLSFSVPKLNLIRATSTSPISTSTIPTPSLSIPENLETQFGRKGIKFLESNNIPIVELSVRNGSSVRLRIPDAHVVSYKPRVHWKDDGFEEVLYTVPENGTDTDKAKGGLGLVINDVSDSKTSPLVNSLEWSVKDVDSDSIDAVQVELKSKNGNLEMTYVISLYPLSMATAIIVKNKGKKDVTLTSAILSHMKFKKRGKSAIQGLKSSTYCTHPPLSSPFELLSPAEAMKTEDPGLFDFGFQPEPKPGTWVEQEVPYTLLKRKVSRVYAAPPEERKKKFYNTPPSKYETLDQSREIFFRMIRVGFEDIYLSSPGSLSEKHGNEYFICTGPASMLVPVVVKPGESWRAVKQLVYDQLCEDIVNPKRRYTPPLDISSPGLLSSEASDPREQAI